MAKSNRPSPKPQAKPASTQTRLEPDPTKNWLERPSNVSETDMLFRKIFLGVAGLSLLLMLGLSFGVGINADDKFQNDYCTKLVNYYGTFGKDSSALFVKDGNMHLYGGFFEVVTGFVNKAFGFTEKEIGYHNVRHFSSALLGWVAILCTALLARLIAGWQAALFTLIIMVLSPRFFGDSLMNPKDIPFAAGYMLALYNLCATLRDMPNPKKWNLVGIAAGIGIALATRAGGLILFPMIFLFAGLHWMFSGRNNFAKYAAIFVGVSVVGYVLAILFWPYALQSPLKNPLNALSQFSALEVRIRVLFEGKNIMSDTTPWYYAPKWIWMTVPIAAIVGFVGSLVLSPRIFKNYNPVFVSLVFFAAIFPVFYVIYKDSVLHDGWRHLTFSYPPVALAAGIFWKELAGFFWEKKAMRYAVLGLFGILLLDSAIFIAANPKMPYVYFNPISGGTKGAVGNFETDYWGISTRQGVEWLENQGILKPDMPEKVVIATNMFYSVKQLCAKYGDKVVVKYLKWDRRCDDAWDYALFPTRYVDGSTLKKGFWPPDNTVHLVTAGGAPILAVLKDNGKNCSLGMASAKIGDWVSSVKFLKSEVQNVPDNDLAWTNLANAYLSLNNTDSAALCIHKALEINPEDSQPNNILGLILMNRNDIAGAKKQFENAIRLEPSNAAAHYYLAVIARNQNDARTALTHVIEAVNLAPNFRPAIELGIQLAESTGNATLAQKLKSMIGQ